MSLGRLNFFSPVLSPHSLTLLRQQSFMTCISAAPIYVREQNLVFLKSLLKKKKKHVTKQKLGIKAVFLSWI